MHITHKFNCPMCGFPMKVTDTATPVNRREVLLCNVDDGGCDEYFAVEMSCKVVSETTVYKLEKQ